MQYGISNLSIVPVRVESSDASEMVSQILFGEQYKILEERKMFSRVRISHDKYEGWICNKQVTEVEKTVYDNLLDSKKLYTKDVLDIIKSDSFLQKDAIIFDENFFLLLSSSNCTLLAETKAISTPEKKAEKNNEINATKKSIL